MGVIVHKITSGMSACGPCREKRLRLCAWAGRVSTGLRRLARLEDPDGVAEEPALPGSLQHGAAAADFGQCLMAAWADG